MFKKVLIGSVALALLLFVVGLLLPGDWSIETSIVVGAGPGRVYREIATLSTWPEWSQWNRQRDPELQHTFSGPQQGKGCTWHWQGHPDRLGRGTLVITAGQPGTGIDYDITLEGHPTARGNIALVGQDDRTEVRWKSSGTAGGGLLYELLTRYMAAVGALEPEMTRHYEASLQRLKFRAESLVSKADAAARKK